MSRHARLFGALAAIVLVRTAAAEAQSTYEVPSAGTRVTLRSEALGEERVLWVWTPPGYSRARPGMPVMYVLDPDVHFRHATSLAQFLGYFLRAPEMIVVGVVSPNRGRDFGPPRDTGTTVSGGGRFLRFMLDELQPFIRQSYNTAPFSVLFGHSFGGLFAVHAAITEPKAFGAVVAISPSLDWSDSLGLRSVRSALARKAELPRFLYLALAALEAPGIAATTRALIADLTAARPAGLRWTSAEIAGENHQTLVYPALHGAMRWLFADWLQRIDTERIITERSLAAFDEPFGRLSTQFGYDVQPSELIISMVGDRLYQRKAWTETIALFARRVALYPESPDGHDELARGYQAAGQLPQAIASFERAVALAESQRHTSLAAIRERLARARGGTR